MPRDFTLIFETFLRSVLGGPCHRWCRGGQRHHARMEQQTQQSRHTTHTNGSVPMCTRHFGDDAEAGPSTAPPPPLPQDLMHPSP
jgi:hypothetical protein